MGLLALFALAVFLLSGYILRSAGQITVGAAGVALGMLLSGATTRALSARRRRADRATKEQAAQAQAQASQMAAAFDAALESWAGALSLHDRDDDIHARRVTDLAVRLGRRAGLDDTALSHLRRGALLHDVGKMAVPDSILRKPGPLTDIEWEIIRRHPVAGYDMLKHIDYLRPALDVVLAHHERWDGGGYPRGLKGEEIPLAARIFALADVYDSLCSDQPYRAAWPKGAIRAYIVQQAGTQFDPTLAQAFLEILED